MKKLQLAGLSVMLVLSISIWYSTGDNYAYSQSTPGGSSKMILGAENSVVSVSASVTVGITNQTLENKFSMLRNAVFSFLNSGPDILKTSDGDRLIIKTKISDQINNSTQNVEGTDAAYAILGVEINRALQSVLSTSVPSNQSAIVTIDTTSVCKPSPIKTVSCENTIKIK